MKEECGCSKKCDFPVKLNTYKFILNSTLNILKIQASSNLPIIHWETWDRRIADAPKKGVRNNLLPQFHPFILWMQEKGLERVLCLLKI